MAEIERTETGDPVASPPPEPAPAPPPVDEATMVAQVVERLVTGIGLRSRLDTVRTREGYYVNILARRATALLIGHRGATLKAIQYLARAIVRKHFPDVPPILVDVAGYAERRDRMLRQKTTAIARIVVETQREMTLDELTEREMRIVQDELRSIDGVRAHAVGDGLRRRVVLSPTLLPGID